MGFFQGGKFYQKSLSVCRNSPRLECGVGGFIRVCVKSCWLGQGVDACSMTWEGVFCFGFINMCILFHCWLGVGS